MGRRYLRRAKRILRAPALPRRARIELLRVALSQGLFGESRFEIDLGLGKVNLMKSDIASDYRALYDVFVNEFYKTDYRGKTVIDGAPLTGYFGAYALLEGASLVLSFEPDRDDYLILFHCAKTFKANGHDWTAYRRKLGPKDEPLDVEDYRTFGDEKADVRSLSSVVKEVKDRFPDSPVLVNVSIEEDSDIDVIDYTPEDVWREVDELFVEMNPIDPYGESDVVDYLERMGLQLANNDDGKATLFHFVR